MHFCVKASTIINAGGHLGTIITPTHPQLGNAPCEDYFLPSVLIWDPYTAYPSFFPSGSIQCCSCGGSTRFQYWNDGSSSSTQPRVLHDMHNIVLLVSAVYRCDNGHKLLAHDESVLKCFPTHRVIPFVLLSRTGFTMDLVNTCTSLCTHGMNFYKIETFVAERRLDTLSKQHDMHIMAHASSGEICHFQTLPTPSCPSNDIIAKMVLAKFLNDEKIYLTEICRIPVGECISFDHTFKVAANIGFLRDDGVWVPQYDSLFIVLNKNGQVLTWQLTKGTAFSQIEILLRELKERASDLTCVYIDECCKLRGKITSIFGTGVLVKLDLFHAVKRITSTLRKKHSLTRQCIEDLQLVFRQNGDSSKKRMLATPKPEEITTKIEHFLTKWKDSKDREGRNVFTPDTADAIRKLKHHISLGCLSDIPPGGGTNRNKRLHHHLNSLFSRTKIGILLAYALLTIVLHAYNSAEKKHCRVVTKAINSSPLRNSPMLHVKPIGIMPKVRQSMEMSSSHHWEIDVSENTLDMELVVPVFKCSIHKHKVMQILKVMGLSRLQKSSSHFQQFHTTHVNECGENTEVSTDLRQTLFAYGLRLQPVKGDGNCFFTSIAYNMLSDLRVWDHCLSLAGTSTSEITVERLSGLLRKVYVIELLGERRAQYESFFPHSSFDYEMEANRFHQDGYFNSELGDTMPLALATALQFPLIIFPSPSNTPVMYVTPDLVTTEATAFVVHTCSGLGHYDAAIPCHKLSHKQSNQDTFIRCSCGVNKKDSVFQSCIPNATPNPA